jgi:hypothetical protein
MDVPFAAWANFYTITGSSAAALTGLMFVVITLVAGQERTQKTVRDGVETFSSPTVIHFCAALFISAVLAAPWREAIYPGLLLGVAGIYGGYCAFRVVLQMNRMWGALSIAEFDDWFWYAIVPLLAYVGLIVGAILLIGAGMQGPFVLAGCTILLIFVGIRNAWDTVTFIAISRSGSTGAGADKLPFAVAGYVSAERVKNASAIPTLFTSDAIVRDENQEYRGVDAIDQWWRDAQRKYRYKMEALGARVEDGTVIVQARLTGDFPGNTADVDYTFTLDGDKIASLTIG